MDIELLSSASSSLGEVTTCSCAVCTKRFGFDEALPDEIWGKIFRLLGFPTLLSHVCSRFNRVFRSHFCYLNKRLRWATSFTKQISTTKTTAQRLETISSIIEGLTNVMQNYNRSSQSLFAHPKAATAAFWVVASHGNLKLLHYMMLDTRIDKTRWDLFCLNIPKTSKKATSSNILPSPSWLFSFISSPFSSLFSFLSSSIKYDNESQQEKEQAEEKEKEKEGANMSTISPAYPDTDDIRIESFLDSPISNKTSCSSSTSKEESDMITDNLLFVVQTIISSSNSSPTRDKNHSFQSLKSCESRNTLLSSASLNGNSGIVRYLLNDPLTNPSANASQCLRLACGSGQTAIVKMLLEDGRVNPAAFDNEALRNASANGHSEVVRLLVDFFQSKTSTAAAAAE